MFLITIKRTVSMITTGFGLNNGWAGPNIPLLVSNETPLPSGKISMDEASWLVALLPVGGLMGNIFFGCAIKTLGRKWPVFSLAIPMIV